MVDPFYWRDTARKADGTRVRIRGKKPTLVFRKAADVAAVSMGADLALTDLALGADMALDTLDVGSPLLLTEVITALGNTESFINGQNAEIQAWCNALKAALETQVNAMQAALEAHVAAMHDAIEADSSTRRASLRAAGLMR